jgi:hypothetical protein
VVDAVELDRIVPPSGNFKVCGQQFWAGLHRVGQTVTLWIDTTTVHLSHGGNAPQDPPLADLRARSRLEIRAQPLSKPTRGVDYAWRAVASSGA